MARYARRLDGLDATIEVTRAEMRAGRPERAGDVRRAIREAARHIRHVARRQMPRGWRTQPVTRRLGRTARRAARPRRLLRARRTLPAALVAADDGRARAGRRRSRRRRRAARSPMPTVMSAALEAGVTRLFRIGGAHAIAALAYGTGAIPRVDKIVGPGNAYVAAAKALVAADCAIDFFAGPSEIRDRGRRAAARLDRRGSHRPGGARPGRARDPRDARAAGWPRASRAAVERRLMPPDGPARTALARNGGIVVDADPATRRSRSANAWRPSTSCAIRGSRARGCGAPARCSSAPTARRRPGDYATGLEPRAADGRRRARPRRPDAPPTSSASPRRSTLTARRAARRSRRPGCRARARRRPGPRHRRSPWTDPPWLRLHLNENTAGCSPRVLETLRRARPRSTPAVYPDYDAATPAGGGSLRASPRTSLLLTNGLDEGILAASGRGPARSKRRHPARRSA